MNKYDFIFAFDPGVKTGFILYSCKNDKIIRHLILEGYRNIHKQLEKVSNSKLYNVEQNTILVLYEKNVGKAITQDQFNMIKKVGFIEGYCISNQIDCEGQTPSVRKGYISLAKKYFESKYNKSDYEVHNIDAFSHVLRYLSKHGYKLPIERNY